MMGREPALGQGTGNFFCGLDIAHDTPNSLSCMGLRMERPQQRCARRIFLEKTCSRGVDSDRMVPYNCAPTLDVSERGRAESGGVAGLTQPVKRPILMSPTREEAL
jgi:hypothetical protein